ncbi:MAG: hypothetical protein U0Y68_20870 [Blastocatellia bacterium]
MQVAAAIQAAYDGGLMTDSDIAGCATRTALKQLFVTADPTGRVTLTTVCGDVWNA